MQRHPGYPHSASPGPNMSSAFSASANPDEDWTKISDLAERRRIQNRIAQRNYRKKLKKRLEDLERRAGSSSASPEQRPAELHRRSIEPRDDSSSSRAPRTSGDRARSSSSGQHTPDPLHHPHPLYPHPHDADWELFAHESSEHYPVSAAPFSSSSSSSSHQHQHNHQHPAYTSSIAYPGAAATATANAYPHHPHYPVSDADPMLWMSGMPQFSASYDGAVKGLDGSGAGGHPFQLGYASIAGADVAGSHYYQDPNAQTPPLSDCFDYLPASPPLTHPSTPASMPGSPLLNFL